MYNYEISATTSEYSRQIYSILDLLGDFGGVMEVFLLITEVLLKPVSEHSFLVKAISKLYLAQTKDDSLL
jgi:hypothetical protein